MEALAVLSAATPIVDQITAQDGGRFDASAMLAIAPVVHFQNLGCLDETREVFVSRLAVLQGRCAPTRTFVKTQDMYVRV